MEGEASKISVQMSQWRLLVVGRRDYITNVHPSLTFIVSNIQDQCQH